MGFRSLETKDALKLGDPFHIASTTKSMTATLAAIFVERGALRWWAVARSRSTGERALSHSGGDGAWQAMLFVRPEARRINSLATNVGGDDIARFLELLREVDDGCTR